MPVAYMGKNEPFEKLPPMCPGIHTVRVQWYAIRRGKNAYLKSTPMSLLQSRDPEGSHEFHKSFS